MVQVEVTESDDGTYWGWLHEGRGSPSMIWYRRDLFEMCFPYGSKIEEEQGKGRVVQLVVSLSTGIPE